ncbi:MAG: hypothetical protein JSS82_18810 [Bacteroidetes bacterium]|nr:hypothetical protein [Bacteroidota bacterium]
MRKLLLMMVTLPACYSYSHARTWDINIENGINWARLIPAAGSTPASRTVKYSFGSPGLYASAGAYLWVSGHSRFNIGYQYSENHIGVKMLVNGMHSTTESTADVVDLHNFSGGYYYSTNPRPGRMKVGCFVKMGIALCHMSGLEGGGSASGMDFQGQVTSGSDRESGFEVMPDTWTPNNTIGITASTNSRSKLADRLSFALSATIHWKNPYINYSSMHYFVQSDNYNERGTIQYKGIPLQLQFGVSYAIFRFGS